MEPNPPVRGSPPGDHAASLAASAALHRSNSAVLLVDVASATLPCCRCHRITIHDSCKALHPEERAIARVSKDATSVGQHQAPVIQQPHDVGVHALENDHIAEVAAAMDVGADGGAAVVLDRLQE